ncbi:MAG: RhbF-like rhizobactin siderophore biosynthesis protein, partial [Micromonosporaceae bacterium]|nr:RhbF-like rhizobactin siderophore biosynthesis protein [Micromonosporaceae bacterium]
AELADARRNAAVGYTRRSAIEAEVRARAGAAGVPDLYGLAATLGADEQLVCYERLATDGHNLHPCGRTRLGWTLPDVLAHDQESPATAVAFVALRRDRHVGEDLGALLREAYPWLPEPPAGHLLQPVHAWQAGRLLPAEPEATRPEGVRAVPVPPIAATPTTAVRTVLLEPDAAGVRHYLKLSLDIQITSTRRTISVASTRNGPAISALLHRLLAGEPDVLLLAEPAGAALRDSRDASAILRDTLSGRLRPGEVAIPGAALPAGSPVTGRSVLAEVVDRYHGGAEQFVEAYARLLLPPVLRLAAAGVGLEAHLQNSIPIFVDGVPTRIAFRDMAGLRLHLPRLARHSTVDWLWPGSVVATHDVDVLRAKVGYTALQAHLGEVIALLAGSHNLDERAAWRRVRAVLDETAADPDDHAYLTAPKVAHKALVRMRISAGSGDIHVPVENPLHDP